MPSTRCVLVLARMSEEPTRQHEARWNTLRPTEQFILRRWKVSVQIFISRRRRQIAVRSEIFQILLRGRHELNPIQHEGGGHMAPALKNCRITWNWFVLEARALTFSLIQFFMFLQKIAAFPCSQKLCRFCRSWVGKSYCNSAKSRQNAVFLGAIFMMPLLHPLGT